MGEVRRAGDNIWRASVRARVGWVLLAAAFVGVTAWPLADAHLSLREKILFAGADIALVSLVPIVVLRWRMVLEHDALYLVFLRVRRLDVRTIVDARVVAGDGLTFVMDDGETQSFQALTNSAWAHRRETPTRADLAARAVLGAAAAARGEDPPDDYRLPPMQGLGKGMLRDGILAGIIGFFGGWR